MSIISNIKNVDDSLIFNINNIIDLKISLINAFRRIIIGDINLYSLENNNNKIIFNNTMLDNSYLLQRLSLIPIKSNKDFDYDSLTISMDVENTTSPIKSYYVNDFIVKDKNDNVINNNDLFVHTGILFCKIKFNQKLTFETNLVLNNANANNTNSVFTPVSNAMFTFKKSDTLIKKYISDNKLSEDEKKNFNLLTASRFYEKNKNDSPSVYIFTIETIGQFYNNELFNICVNILISKLDVCYNALKNNDSDKINIIKADTKMIAYDFIFTDEEDTIGNLLSQYLLDRENIHYVGYVVPHPLENKMIIRVSYNNKDELENIKNELYDVIDTLKDKLNKILIEFNKNFTGNKLKESSNKEVIENIDEENPTKSKKISIKKKKTTKVPVDK